MVQISIYNNYETSFTHNGIVLSDAIYCVIEEELNGKYILELTHPVDDRGMWQHLSEENIIKADGQLFRIHATEKDLSYVYVYARHIFYDLLHNFLEDVRPTAINGSGALNWILTNTQYPHNFIGMSDIDRLNTQYYIRKNPAEAMLGADSLVTRWGGELVRDNYQIRLLNQMGANKGAQIAYGKNMLGLEVNKDMDTVMTRIMPIGADGLLLPEKYIDSPLIDNYTFPYIRKVEFDVGIDDETTEQQAFEKLRKGASDLYEINKVDIPHTNIVANLLLLENTEEYKHIKNLVKVGLGDIVSCTDNPLNITFESKVIRVKKDVLGNKNIEVELGQFKKGISNTIQSAIEEVSEEIKKNTSDLEKAIDNATELITSALGGHVIKRPGELLIMDTDNINTATEIWRWNLNGLGYSGTGINGPYRLAITMNGEIVADFITTGTLNAGLIKTGVLMSKDGKTWINMDNGAFNFKDKLLWQGNQLKLINSEIRANHNDGSYTQMDNAGLRRHTTRGDKDYLYLTHSGEGNTENPNGHVQNCYLLKRQTLTWTHQKIDIISSISGTAFNIDYTSYKDFPIYKPQWSYNWLCKPAGGTRGWDTRFSVGDGYNLHNEIHYIEEVDVLEWIPVVTFQLPTDFRGKNFKVALSISQFDIPNRILFRGIDYNLVGSPKMVLEVTEINYDLAYFKVKAYYQIYNFWEKQHELSGFEPYPGRNQRYEEGESNFYAQGIKFNYVVTA